MVNASRNLPEWMEEVAPDLYCIDCDYVQPRLASVYLMVNDQGRAAFLETNTSLAVPRFLEALKTLELSPEKVDWIIPTHVHLDHAGGAGALLQECKQATVLAHPRAARHLINPERLIQSSMQVYGQEVFERLYGEIVPCPESRVRIMSDGEVLGWGNRSMEFLHTRGHANHHFCIHEKGSGVFTGDSFGIAYPDLQDGGPFLFASSTPTDFDPPAAHESLNRIRSTGAGSVFLTHFGRLDSLDEANTQLHASLDFLTQLYDDAKSALNGSEGTASTRELEDTIQQRILQSWVQQLKERGYDDAAAIESRLKMDATLNAGGIVFAAERAAKKG